MSTILYIVRHGETAWNRGNIFRGTHDIPLNDNGRAQAALAVEALRTEPIDAAYTSPLSRAAETGSVVMAPHGMPAVADNGLLDFDYGEWTGKEDKEIAKLWPAEHAAWCSQPDTVRAPGGNTLQEVSDKASATLAAICDRHDGQTVALFSHRVVNKLIILSCLGLDLARFPFVMQGNCCINRLGSTPSGYIAHYINDTSHIRNAGAALLDTDF